MKSRQLEFHQSYNEFRSYLHSTFDFASWTSIRGERLSVSHDQLPSEMWGEILSFLSNDILALEECFLVLDVRTGFFYPIPITSFSPKESPLLSMIPLIEGHLHSDKWTIERLYHLGFDQVVDTTSAGSSSLSLIERKRRSSDADDDDGVFPYKKKKSLLWKNSSFPIL